MRREQRRCNIITRKENTDLRRERIIDPLQIMPIGELLSRTFVERFIIRMISKVEEKAPGLQTFPDRVRHQTSFSHHLVSTKSIQMSVRRFSNQLRCGVFWLDPR